MIGIKSRNVLHVESMQYEVHSHIKLIKFAFKHQSTYHV
jgi:hypothetical protein